MTGKTPTPEPISEALRNDLRHVVARQPYPLLFATVSGAHLYGFPSTDSDVDLRGVHLLPAPEIVGLELGEETLETADKCGDVHVDLVTHDAKKFILMLLKPNGYVLEQLHSPLIVQTTAEHAALKKLALGCVTRHHSHHYLGFADNQWKLFEKEYPRRVKPLLYVFRVLLTGTYLMQTGEIEANLWRLNDLFRLPYLAELIARKTEGAEKSLLHDDDVTLYRQEVLRLREALEQAAQRTALPVQPSNTTRRALHDLLVSLRLRTPVKRLPSAHPTPHRRPNR
jgi:hypothetical protein